MNEERLTPKTCRERAQMCRNMARTRSDPEKRKEYEDLAAGWEQLCGEIEKMEAKG